MTLDEFNQLTAGAAYHALYDCCHCQAWALTLVQQRPFASLERLAAAAEERWHDATEAEILEAFGGHARIGDIELLRSRFAGRASAEQGQVAAAPEEVLQQLNALNIEYLKRYGFIFIVCATGKSAEEMLQLLKARMNNGRNLELQNGAREQAAITRLRLNQLFGEGL